MTTIVLASGSPRRKDLLDALDLRFEVLPVDIDETPHEGETPLPLVRRLSKQKARAAADLRRGEDALVLAADTIVVLDEAVLGKPDGADQNRSFLRQLSGRAHHVLTGHTLLRSGRCETVVVDTEVRMRELSDGEIERYVATGEGLDKAGGYAIQGRGSALVSGVTGCYYNVVGLSVPTVVEAAARLGVPLV